MSAGPGKLTKKRARALLEEIGRAMSSNAWSALEAACALWKGSTAAGTPEAAAKALQIRKLMWRAGVGALFDALTKHAASSGPPIQSDREKIAEALRKLAQGFARAKDEPDAKSGQRSALAEQFDKDAGARAAAPPPAPPQEWKPGQQQAPPAPQPGPTAAERLAQLQREADARVQSNAQAQRITNEQAAKALEAIARDRAQAKAKAIEAGMLPAGGSGREDGGDLRTAPNTRRTQLGELQQEMTRLRDSLAARTMSRTERELEHGRPDLSRLALIGAGLTLRPYQETTLGRALDTVVYLMIDRSSSMADSGAFEVVTPAAWAIANACQHARVKFLLGTYDTAPYTLTRCAPLGKVREWIETLRSYGGTDAPEGVKLAIAELSRIQARRRVLVMLCDGHFAPDSDVWPLALKRGIDFRMTSLAGRLDAAQHVASKLRGLDVWKDRCAIVTSAAGAAHAMIRELRVMLDKGSRSMLEPV
jgi:hypothetical protein